MASNSSAGKIGEKMQKKGRNPLEVTAWPKPLAFKSLIFLRILELPKMRDLFSRYPRYAEVADNKHGESGGTSKIVRGKRDDIFAKYQMTNSEIANKLVTLASRIEKDPKFRQIAGKRSTLPIAPFKDVITCTVESHQVVLICGETGCGKTTQVPQFLLDHARSKGETCKIGCTQPRRISATSVAERIVSERGETVGNSVGYKIRLESKGGGIHLLYSAPMGCC